MLVGESQIGVNLEEVEPNRGETVMQPRWVDNSLDDDPR
jgi:hypothetical protein